MPSPDFQIAIARLIASPELCRKTLRDEESFFADYDLTEKEKKRLHAVLRQKGMSACCSLYRMNRITPLYTQLSNTATLLGPELVPLVEAFWQQQPDSTLQFKEEVLAFGHFLMNKVENGNLKMPYLKEVLKLEMAINELSYVPEGEFRVLQFDHDITGILLATSRGTLQTEKIEPNDTVYKMYLENQQLKMDII